MFIKMRIDEAYCVEERRQLSEKCQLFRKTPNGTVLLIVEKEETSARAGLEPLHGSKGSLLAKSGSQRGRIAVLEA
jgi:hypothetical protein